MSTDTGENLLNPGDTPHDNAQFLVFCVAVIRAVAKYPELLRVSISGSGQRSSPGRQRGAAGHHLDLPRRPAAGRDRAAGKGRRPRAPSRAASWRSASACCRKLPRDAGDRNRTSPFAFTGNKFEFRAVGGSQSIAGPNTVLNTIVAESLDFMATQSRKGRRQAARTCNKAIQDLLPGIIKESKKVLFNGDNYSEEWHQEAEKRGLPNLQEHRRCPAGDHPQGHDRAVHQVQGLQRERAAEPVHDPCGALRQDGEHRGPADGA